MSISYNIEIYKDEGLLKYPRAYKEALHVQLSSMRTEIMCVI